MYNFETFPTTNSKKMIQFWFYTNNSDIENKCSKTQDNRNICTEFRTINSKIVPIYISIKKKAFTSLSENFKTDNCL